MSSPLASHTVQPLSEVVSDDEDRARFARQQELDRSSLRHARQLAGQFRASGPPDKVGFASRPRPPSLSVRQLIENGHDNPFL